MGDEEEEGAPGGERRRAAGGLAAAVDAALSRLRAEYGALRARHGAASPTFWLQWALEAVGWGDALPCRAVSGGGGGGLLPGAGSLCSPVGGARVCCAVGASKRFAAGTEAAVAGWLSWTLEWTAPWPVCSLNVTVGGGARAPLQSRALRVPSRVLSPQERAEALAVLLQALRDPNGPFCPSRLLLASSSSSSSSPSAAATPGAALLLSLALSLASLDPSLLAQVEQQASAHASDNQPSPLQQQQQQQAAEEVEEEEEEEVEREGEGEPPSKKQRHGGERAAAAAAGAGEAWLRHAGALLLRAGSDGALPAGVARALCVAAVRFCGAAARAGAGGAWERALVLLCDGEGT